MGWNGGFGWDELLRSQRVLIISEAGAGKTFECRAQQEKLFAAGQPAFFLELATLAGNPVRDMLLRNEEDRLETWFRSQSETATFFLDSIDELKLSLGSFELALKRLNKEIAGQLGRARIVITTRPVPMDQEIISRLLPVLEPCEAVPTAEAFADRVMERGKNKTAEKTEETKQWRYVGLMPLSREQMREFATLQKVADPHALLADIQERDAEEFAERPQDLVELCADWREHHRIRCHRDQVTANIATKLKPKIGRRERAELSLETAIEGASRLALAAMLTRKLTLRYSADSDSVDASEAALDEDVQAADLLQEYEAKIAALERMVGRQALEIELLKGALKHAPRQKSASTSVVTGPADLTYVTIPGGFVYLAAILDAWSRKVVGYAISRSMDARIAVAALKAAIRTRNPAKGCIHHSDRGSQLGFNQSSQRPCGLTADTRQMPRQVSSNPASCAVWC
jgi:phage host-nuclease inhibitor protein Gam